MAIRYEINPINNKRFSGEKPSYKVSIRHHENYNHHMILQKMSEQRSYSRGIVAGVLDDLIDILGSVLSDGHTVTLDGLGTFSLSAELKDPGIDPEEIDGKDIRIKRVCFQASPDFRNRIKGSAHFQKVKPKIKIEYVKKESGSAKV